MTKKKIIVYFFLAVLIIARIVFIQTKNIKAQETASTTFPVDEAGIAAYIRADGITVEKISQIPFETIKKQGKTFIYGKLKFPDYGPQPPHLYIGLDGWIVVYYLREEAASKILQLSYEGSGTSRRAQLQSNNLERALTKICQNYGFTCSNEIKYYDFEFPQANKMALIGECAGWFCSNENSFLISGYGTLYQASYSMNPTADSVFSLVAIKGDEEVFRNEFTLSANQPIYGEYPISIFEPLGDQGIKIIFKKVRDYAGGYASALLGTVFIYKSD